MSKEQMVGSRLPPELLKDLETIEKLEQTDRSTTVRKLLRKAIEEWKLEHFARQYGAGKITLARAAHEAGVSLWEIMDYTRQHKIPAQYSLEDLEHDLKVIQKEEATNRASGE